MSIIVAERTTSRKQTVDPKNGSTISLDFVALRSEDDTAIYAAVLAECPSSYGTLKLSKIDLDPQGGGVWYATAVYAKDEGSEVDVTGVPDAQPGDTDPLGAEFTFDTTGGTAHITQSIATVSKTRVGGGDAPDYKQTIGVSKDGVAGVDIPAPKLEFQITRNVSFVTLAYIRAMSSMTGKVNDAEYFGFSSGELMFLGASGRTGSDGKCKVTWKFAGSENVAEVVVSDELTVSTGKDGWDYLWCTYGKAVSEGEVVSRPTAAYVEQIAERVDFTALGI